MTCVVGLIHRGKVYIGGDSAGVAGLNIRARKDEKVFVTGEYAMGFSHSFRIGQVLTYDFEPPAIESEDEGNLMRFMVKKFIPAIRTTLKNAGMLNLTENVESMDAMFMVGVRGRLFTIASDLQVGETLDDFTAIGCGEEYALGSFHTTEGSNMKPLARVEKALQAASRFSAGVCEPFNFVQTTV